MRVKNITHHWDEEKSKAICLITTTNNKTFTGIAFCHPEDEDMKSEKTGCFIAECRAQIEFLKAKKYELKIELKGLKQLYYSMKHSTKFNPKSYENKMLQRRIHALENDLTIVNEILTTTAKGLKVYIEEKEKFYKNIRLRRSARVKTQQTNN